MFLPHGADWLGARAETRCWNLEHPFPIRPPENRIVRAVDVECWLIVWVNIHTVVAGVCWDDRHNVISFGHDKPDLAGR